MVGCSIWVVEYENLNFSDCNGIFSTREKATASLMEDVKRCSDIWSNFKCEYFSDDWGIYTFNCQNDFVRVCIYETIIQ